MSDRFTPEKRSVIMARIGGKDTAPEITVRRLLHKMGFRFRLHRKDLPGKPDIVLPKRKTVIFVHGCFWHGHSCPRGHLPATNREFWEEKIEKNKRRDKDANKRLCEAHWNVVVVWQCEIKDLSDLERRLLEACHAETQHETVSGISSSRTSG